MPTGAQGSRHHGQVGHHRVQARQRIGLQKGGLPPAVDAEVDPGHVLAAQGAVGGQRHLLGPGGDRRCGSWRHVVRDLDFPVVLDLARVQKCLQRPALGRHLHHCQRPGALTGAEDAHRQLGAGAELLDQDRLPVTLPQLSDHLRQVGRTPDQGAGADAHARPLVHRLGHHRKLEPDRTGCVQHFEIRRGYAGAAHQPLGGGLVERHRHGQRVAVCAGDAQHLANRRHLGLAGAAAAPLGQVEDQIGRAGQHRIQEVAAAAQPPRPMPGAAQGGLEGGDGLLGVVLGKAVGGFARLAVEIADQVVGDPDVQGQRETSSRRSARRHHACPDSGSVCMGS